MVTRSASRAPPSQYSNRTKSPRLAMSAYYKMGQDASDYPAVNFDQLTEDTYLNGTLVNEHIDVQGNHRELIRTIGAASTVLLKNDGNSTLPLNASAYRHWGIFGSDAGVAADGPNGCVDRGCDSGTLAMGWGSGKSLSLCIFTLFTSTHRSFTFRQRKLPLPRRPALRHPDARSL